MAPIAAAFRALWPQAQCMNLLEDRLSQDLAASGSLDGSMSARIAALALYARDAGADAILFTCSAFGPAIDAAARKTGVPTLKPNQAMFDAAIALCAARPHARIGLLTTFAPAAKSMHEELREAVQASGRDIQISVACADGAMPALDAGDRATHDRLVIERAHELADCDVLLLGQFSMAHAREAVAAATGKTVLTSPDSAVRRLRNALSASTPSPNH